MSLLLYGAYGYTGRLLAREAVRRGLKPVLAGRSDEKLSPLAAELGLSRRVFSLDDPAEVRRGLEGVKVVLHAAGPFARTAPAMLRGCLDASASYADITGEIAVFEQVFALDAEARTRGVTLLPGVGFDVVPTDCLALHVARKVPNARTLDIAFAILTRASRGTFRSTVEHAPEGIWVRRGGKLTRTRLGAGTRKIRFSDRDRWGLPIPWGDLATAYRTTGIPDITTFVAPGRRIVQAARLFGPVLAAAMPLLGTRPVRSLVDAFTSAREEGPDEAHRARGRSFIWARAAGDGGEAEAWLETIEAYQLTAVAGIMAATRLLAGGVAPGATTPALAFGPDFVLEVPGTRRLDALA